MSELNFEYTIMGVPVKANVSKSETEIIVKTISFMGKQEFKFDKSAAKTEIEKLLAWINE